jgi:hypothetical protein
MVYRQLWDKISDFGFCVCVRHWLEPSLRLMQVVPGFGFTTWLGQFLLRRLAL